MSDALHHALDKIGRALERGVQEAELELADARERCRWLETEVRSLRAAVRPVIPEVAPLLFRPTVADAEEQPVVIEHPALARAQELSHRADAVVVASERSQPHTVPAPSPEQQGEDTGSTSYMPMLEELWGIARRDGSA